jgi:O-antigen/teichoic acid export membrane protein
MSGSSRRWRPSDGLARDTAITYAFSGLILLTNLVTGVLVARELGPSGRGELAAITNTAAWIGVLFVLGCREAVSYHQARHPEDAGRLLSTWLVLLLPSAGLAILAGELALPALFSAQTANAIHLGSLFLVVSIPTFLLTERLWGALLGDHDFVFWNITRFMQPGLVALAYVVLWRIGELSLRSALVVLLLAGLSTAMAAGVRVLRGHGLARPSLELGRRTLSYGLRGQFGESVTLMNARLDLLIIPAFFSAASVGYYSIATNISWIIVALANPMFSLVLPIAARQGSKGPQTVIKTMHATLAIGTLFALVIGLTADLAIPAVYGPDFGASILPLRLLLPGSVLYGAAVVLASGLYAAGRPFTASIPQAVGLVVTAVGLLVFLRSGGIEAAAIVSTASYAVVFLLALVLYGRTAGLRWRAYLSAPARPDYLVSAPAGREA